jgi:hypothetical protein
VTGGAGFILHRGGSAVSGIGAPDSGRPTPLPIRRGTEDDLTRLCGA